MEDYIGSIRLFAGNYAPEGWMLCNGQVLTIKQNTALFTILGNRYGGDGKTTFMLPNLQTRVAIGAKSGSKTSNGFTPRNLAEVGGEMKHQLTISEIPNHTHVLRASTAIATKSNGTGNIIAAPTSLSGNPTEAILGFTDTLASKGFMNPQAIALTGASLPHNNMQPYVALSYIICAQGNFPPKPAQ